jgi:hypothetical protein
VLSTSAQKLVRPVKVANPCVFWPRASQVVFANCRPQSPGHHPLRRTSVHGRCGEEPSPATGTPLPPGRPPQSSYARGEGNYGDYHADRVRPLSGGRARADVNPAAITYLSDLRGSIGQITPVSHRQSKSAGAIRSRPGERHMGQRRWHRETACRVGPTTASAGVRPRTRRGGRSSKYHRVHCTDGDPVSTTSRLTRRRAFRRTLTFGFSQNHRNRQPWDSCARPAHLGRYVQDPRQGRRSWY